jgi:shikimate kinase
MTQQHIILIGFKNTGKSTIARLLAQKLDRSFFDSDKEIESSFHKTYPSNLKELGRRQGDESPEHSFSYVRRTSHLDNTPRTSKAMGIDEKKYNCREIMQHYGTDFFKALETATLKELIARPPSVIALGGGTPLQRENQALIAPYCLIHLTAKPDIVFQRIMKNGLPAFFPSDIDPRMTFDQLWEERDKVYRHLTTLCVENSADIYGTVDEVYRLLTPNL